MNQLNYQKQKQLQDQRCSNENMSYVFATMESIYFQTTIKPEYYNKVFDYWKINNFELGNLEDKLYQLDTQIMSYETSVMLYVKKNSYYDFPENFDSEKVQLYLNYWKKNEFLKDYCVHIENLLINLGSKKENFKRFDEINQHILAGAKKVNTLCKSVCL